jgi:osmotically-inducible protein OsmY
MTATLRYLICALAVFASVGAGPILESQSRLPKPKSDAEITRLIRQALRGDKALSSDARQVKIVTNAGYVTLKGRVRSAEEKTVVEAKAAQIAGDDYIKSELGVVTTRATVTSGKN